MIPREQFDAYNRAVANLTSGSSHEVEAAILAWRVQNPGASVAETRDAAIEIMSGFMQNFDEAAASLAAKWYDLQAERAHYKLPSAVTVSSYNKESVEKVARYQAEKLVDGDWPGFAKMCGEAAANDARLSLNRTILANAKRDRKKGVRFARVTTGAETCPFCYMMSSRGAVYYSRKTAGAFDRWHNNCDCKVVMGFEDDPDAEVVQHYDPKGMRDRIKEMEEQTGLSFNSREDSGALRDFMALHDPDWLMYGKEVEVGYVDEAAKAKKLEDKDHPAELRAANRLRVHGFRVVFVDDEPKEFDEAKGIWQVVGLPDLDTGLEIKNVSTATSENTISKHIGKSKKTKRGLKQIVIDVSENPNITDEKAREMISNSLRRHSVASALMVNHQGDVEMVFHP